MNNFTTILKESIRHIRNSYEGTHWVVYLKDAFPDIGSDLRRYKFLHKILTEEGYVISESTNSNQSSSSEVIDFLKVNTIPYSNQEEGNIVVGILPDNLSFLILPKGSKIVLYLIRLNKNSNK